MRKGMMALYGNVKIPRLYCEECGGMGLVIDGAMACCGVETQQEVTRYGRMSEPAQKRKQPVPAAKREILEAQDNRCFYCERQFGSLEVIREKVKRISIEWDHLVPYSLTQNNYPHNFVAACYLCNRMKRDMLFQTIEEARLFLLNRWEAKLR